MFAVVVINLNDVLWLACMNVWWVYLAPQNIPSTVVLTLGNRLYCAWKNKQFRWWKRCQDTRFRWWEDDRTNTPGDDRMTGRTLQVMRGWPVQTVTGCQGKTCSDDSSIGDDMMLGWTVEVMASCQNKQLRECLNVRWTFEVMAGCQGEHLR